MSEQQLIIKIFYSMDLVIMDCTKTGSKVVKSFELTFRHRASSI